MMKGPKKKKILAGSLLVLISSSIILTIIISNNSNYEYQEIGSIEMGNEVFQVKVIDDIAYIIVGNPLGLAIVNVSKPNQPELLSNYYGGGAAQFVDISGDIAYIANRFEGLEIVNVSDPTSPVRISHYKPEYDIFDVKINGNIAYLACWNDGVEIIDISVPNNPIFLSSYMLNCVSMQLVFDNDLIYAVSHCADYSGLQVINVSNPSTPQFVGSYDDVDVDLWIPIIEDNYLYAPDHGGSGSVQVLDISNPQNIVKFDEITICHHSQRIFINENHLYIADSAKGILTLDLDTFEQLGRYDDGSESFDVVYQEGLIYLLDYDWGLKIIQVSET
ncbi:LVIVD repeat-containing protein [Promethearchaeum syntrophicum]|uniref:LVIVD repeat-containing protein n=1 Tax=Promethearchaeum syntrophicum TaxID=2594042 RepID=A0A5B9DF36_9ARCH|nr:hypothetical protein [Candidatus Prometheoarchaeum syntrophicum]QEE17949.1 LVIVD repeat protein [Candidatus Prometheoarchaeum syntrophicum]